MAMTGTPVENSLVDLWSIFDFLNPSVFPPLHTFKATFDDKAMNIDLFAKLKQYLYYGRPYSYIMRRVKKDMQDSFPIKESINYSANYCPEQYTSYNQLKSQMSGDRRKVLPLLADINLLHQSYTLYKNKYDNSKWISEFLASEKSAILLKILTEIRARNEKVLIFALLKNMQNLLKVFIEQSFQTKVDILNGSVPIATRSSIIKNFEDTKNNFAMILSPRAAGVGINLVCANHVIHYGRWWNPAVENQATDRVYRIGQNKNVKVYYINHVDRINKNNPVRSFDELLNELMQFKQNLADDFLAPANLNYATELSNMFVAES